MQNFREPMRANPRIRGQVCQFASPFVRQEMRMRRFTLGSSVAFLLAVSASNLAAQSFATRPCPDAERSGGWFSGQNRVCEVRTATLPLVNGHLAVAGRNGSIEVTGEDRRDILLEAQVEAQAPSRDEAEAIEHKIQILTNGEIHADGPQSSGWSRQSWSVSYRLRVPRRLEANLHTENGSLKLADLDGAITAETSNGSMTLSNLAGDVNAHTVNGSVRVSLEGNQWKGGGLSARTTNGSVSVSAAADYSAHLVADTVNGGVHVGFPVTVQGRIGHHIDSNIGQGGSTLRFETVNGSLRLDRI
jgi:hypothetical protein